MINIIAAVAKNGVIGSGGKIPWDIPEDRAHFRKLTTGGVVIMGRKTFEEIGRPLPDRYNIVVSEKIRFIGDRLISTISLTEAVKLAEGYVRSQDNVPEIFLCGGEKIYREGMKIARRLYLTELDDEYEGDVYFPEFSPEEFRLTEKIRSDSNTFSYCIYERTGE